MATFTVTATAAGSTSNGIGLSVHVITGASASQPGQVAAATQITPSLAITPTGTGSLVFGSLLGLAGTYTVNGSTTNDQDGHSIGGLELLAFHGTSPTTSGTPVTLGYTATSNGISICLCEILTSATLAIDGSSPAGVTTGTAIFVTTGSFTPPGSSLLVASIQANGAGGAATMGVTDTSGLGLSWVEQVKQNGAGNGYSGVWTAAVPAGAPPAAPVVFRQQTSRPVVTLVSNAGWRGAGHSR